MKLNKKILAASMTAAMSLSLAAPAFAAISPTLDIASKMQVPTLNIIAPTNTGVVLNPYGMVVSDKDLNIEEQSGQIISPVMYVQSKTDVPVRVELQATPTAAKGVEMVATAPTNTTTDKQIYLGIGYQFVDTADATMTYNLPQATDRKANPAGATAADKPGSTVINEQKYVKGLENSETTATNTVGENVFQSAYNGNEAGTYLALKMAGKMTGNPTTAWSAEDTLNIALAFTFSPVKLEPSVSITGSTSVAASGNTTLTATVSNGTAASYAWTITTTGGGKLTFNGGSAPTTATAQIDAAADATSSTPETVTVTVTLDDGSTVTDSVTVTGP